MHIHLSFTSVAADLTSPLWGGLYWMLCALPRGLFMALTPLLPQDLGVLWRADHVLLENNRSEDIAVCVRSLFDGL